LNKFKNLSFTAPVEIELEINQCAARHGRSRSRYIVFLILRDLGSMIDEDPYPLDMLYLPKIPPRIRRPEGGYEGEQDSERFRQESRQQKNFVSLSITVQSELFEPINRLAAARRMNRSQYICWLVQQDMQQTHY
jgi:hypothetical protein